MNITWLERMQLGHSISGRINLAGNTFLVLDWISVESLGQYLMPRKGSGAKRGRFEEREAYENCKSK